MRRAACHADTRCRLSSWVAAPFAFFLASLCYSYVLHQSHALPLHCAAAKDIATMYLDDGNFGSCIDSKACMIFLIFLTSHRTRARRPLELWWDMNSSLCIRAWAPMYPFRTILLLSSQLKNDACGAAVAVAAWHSGGASLAAILSDLVSGLAAVGPLLQLAREVQSSELSDWYQGQGRTAQCGAAGGRRSTDMHTTLWVPYLLGVLPPQLYSTDEGQVACLFLRSYSSTLRFFVLPLPAASAAATVACLAQSSQSRQADVLYTSYSWVTRHKWQQRPYPHNDLPRYESYTNYG